MKIFITGAAGYVGAMLVDQLSRKWEVEAILALDKAEIPDLIKDNKKAVWITANTNDDSWVKIAKNFNPDVVIHTAWQIREMFGQKKLQWAWNIEGSNKVFNFALNHPSVKKLIHFSTVASYSARPTNSIDHLFTEEEGFRKSDYLYAEEKRICEENLEKKFIEAKKNGSKTQVVIIRPAAITGPRGRYMRIRFGLQAALSGQLKESFIHRLISAMVSFVPVTKKWCRQFIHEDDINDIVELFVFKNLVSDYEAFNACPPGPVVRGEDMAKAVGKKMIKIHPYLIRFVFFIMWNFTLGRVPTSRGGWKSYSYPIAVDGTKLTKMYGYQYKWQSKDAFVKKEGRYAKYIE